MSASSGAVEAINSPIVQKEQEESFGQFFVVKYFSAAGNVGQQLWSQFIVMLLQSFLNVLLLCPQKFVN